MRVAGGGGEKGPKSLFAETSVSEGISQQSVAMIKYKKKKTFHIYIFVIKRESKENYGI